MLSFVTGLPGAGKTLYLLAKVIKQYRGRPIFVHGIPGIDYEYFGAQELEDPTLWYECPEASVIIIDEAQKVFPVRPAGSPVPRKCAEFETHRHKGFDIVLLTQDASLLDVHARKLANKHIHVLRLFGGHSANVYEYAEYQPTPTAKTARQQCLSTSTFRYPKDIFDRYKSADAHTVKRKIPARLIVFPLMLVACLGVGWWLWSVFSDMWDRYGNPSEQIEAMDGGGSRASSPDPDKPDRRFDPVRAFIPTVEGIPWTAPAYAELNKPKTMPKPQCIIIETVPFGSECRCYTQQATLMKGFPENACREIARLGWFDYTRDERGDGWRESASRRPTREQPNRDLAQSGRLP